MNARRYVIVSIVRDEEPYLEQTIRSVFEQTIPPVAWLVLDDGSADGTPKLLAEAAAKVSWMEITIEPSRHERSAGEATSQGFNRLLPRAREFAPDAIVKLDGDLSFPPDYFERLLQALEDDPRLGIVGGRALEPHADGTWGLVRIPAYHVHGATKVYRTSCLDDIGELTPGPGWDTADIVRARLAGWTTRSLPEVRFRHLRVTGKAVGRLRNLWVKGLAAYRIGYAPAFALLRAARNLVRPPLFAGGVAFLVGYLDGWRRRVPRLLRDDEVAAFRREQLRALTGRKSWWRE